MIENGGLQLNTIAQMTEKKLKLCIKPNLQTKTNKPS